MDFYVPIKTVSEANQREHWAVKHKRKLAQQEAVTVVMQNYLRRQKVSLPCTVKFTRIGPRKLDTDNLAGAFKAIRDAVARRLGVDDGDDRVTWEYDQKPTGNIVYGVKVEISQTLTAASQDKHS